MATADINLNSAQCMKTVSDFGVDHIHNICSGIVTDVAWGSVDWVNASLLGVVGILLLAGLMVLIFMCVMMFRDLF